MNIDWDSHKYSDVSGHNQREQLIAAVKKRFQWLWLYGDKS